MNILHVIPTLGCGGAEVLVSNLAIQQAKSGHVVKIVILEPLHYTFDNFIAKDELQKLVTIEKISTKIKFLFFKRRVELSNTEFNDIVLNFSPTIIHSHLFQAELIARHTLVDTVKYFSHCHNNMSQFTALKKGTLKRRLTDFLEVKWLLSKYKKCNNQFIVISRDTQIFFKRNLPKIFHNYINYLPNAISSSLYYSSKNKSDSLIKLITVGNLLQNKGHLFLINSVYELKKMKYNIQLDILGYGELEKELIAKITELDLLNEVKLRGSVNNVPEYLSRADIYIHGAFKEAFGLVLLEAMASHLPVVTTNGGGNSELIQNDINGYLIEFRNSIDFIDKIKYLIDNKNIRLRMGENSFKFSESYNIDKYENILNQLYSQN